MLLQLESAILDVSESPVVSFQSEVCVEFCVLCHVSKNCEQIQRQVTVDSRQKAFQMSKVISTVQSRHSCVLSVHQYEGERLWKDFVEFQVPCIFLLQMQRLSRLTTVITSSGSNEDFDVWR